MKYITDKYYIYLHVIQQPPFKKPKSLVRGKKPSCSDFLFPGGNIRKTASTSRQPGVSSRKDDLVRRLGHSLSSL